MLLKAQKNGTIKGVWIYWHSIHEPFTLCRWLLYFFANDIIFFLNSKIKKYIKKSVMWQPAWLSPDRKKKKNNYTIVVNDQVTICANGYLHVCHVQTYSERNIFPFSLENKNCHWSPMPASLLDVGYHHYFFFLFRFCSSFFSLFFFWHGTYPIFFLWWPRSRFIHGSCNLF